MQDDFEQAYESNGYAAKIYGKGGVARHSYDSALYLTLRLNSTTLKHRILFHHIWKTGGTHFCDMALDAGLAAPRNPGCHIWADKSAPVNYQSELDWQPCALSTNNADELEATPFSFIGHECPVSHELLQIGHAHAFKWVTILRCPYEQAVSWYRHILKVGPEDAATRTRMWPTAMAWAKQRKEMSGFESFIDNIQTRWLAGDDCVNMDKLTDVCLHNAKTNLGVMDNVLEQAGTGLVGMWKLYGLGWPEKAAGEDALDKPQPDETTWYVGNMSAHEKSFFEEMQHFDIKLLSWGRAQGII